jgi:hypothetical protein
LKKNLATLVLGRMVRSKLAPIIGRFLVAVIALCQIGPMSADRYRPPMPALDKIWGKPVSKPDQVNFRFRPSLQENSQKIVMLASQFFANFLDFLRKMTIAFIEKLFLLLFSI